MRVVKDIIPEKLIWEQTVDEMLCLKVFKGRPLGQREKQMQRSWAGNVLPVTFDEDKDVTVFMGELRSQDFVVL